MNLISKEYLAARSDRGGVLIISETAGASKELVDAIIVNPNNQIEISEAIRYALEMPEEAQIDKNKTLSARLKSYNVSKWAEHFITSLDEVKKIQEIKLAKRITHQIVQEISDTYGKASRRILFLDYDGTLMGFDKDPQKVYPDKELYDILKKLLSMSRNTQYFRGI